MIFQQPHFTTSKDGEESYGSRKRIVSEMNNLLNSRQSSVNEFYVSGGGHNNVSNLHLLDSDDDEEENIINQYNIPTSATYSSTEKDYRKALPTLKQLFQSPERPDPINLWQFYKFLATSPNGKLINLLDFFLDYKSHTQFIKNSKSSETIPTETFLTNNIKIQDINLNVDAIFETYFKTGSTKFIMELSFDDIEETLPIVCESTQHLLEAELYPIFLKSLTYYNIHSTRTCLQFTLAGACLMWLGFWLYYCFVFLNMNRAFRLIPIFLILFGTYMALNIGFFRLDILLYKLDLIQTTDNETDSDNIGRIGKEKSFKVGDELTFNSFGKRGEFIRKFSNFVYGGTFINYKKEYGIHYILKKRIIKSAGIYIVTCCVMIAILLGVPGRRL
ncbi:hypothetical protein QEN19_003655 [Hanseniaspora menglaensis]